MKIYPDISHHHPVKDWTDIKKSCSFVISKATEGRTYVDPTLDSFIRNCEAKKIPYWLYAFLVKGNEKAQAEFMVKICKSKVGPYFVGYILDVESGNTASGVKKALDYINGLGYKTMIYTMYAECSRYKSVIAGRGKNCAWWEARYGRNNGYYSSKYPCHSGVDLHQYTSFGKCPGISDRIDLNRITGMGKNADWFKTRLDTKKNEPAKVKGSKKKTYSGEFPVLPPQGYYKLGDGYITLKDYPTQIKRLQKFLNWHMNTALKIDGKYGELTEFVVKGFQEGCGLKADGLFGKKSLKKAKTVKR